MHFDWASFDRVESAEARTKGSGVAQKLADPWINQSGGMGDEEYSVTYLDGDQVSPALSKDHTLLY